MVVFRPVALFLALAAMAARLDAGEPQPNRIALGTVHTGAIVEASFMLYEPGKDPNITLEVTAPKFVKVLHKNTGTQELGAGNHFVFGSVELAIDTSAAGELSGEVKVTLGKATAKVPVSATVKPQRRGLHRLLMVETPFERQSTHNGEDFKAWTTLVGDAPLDVNYLLVSRGKPVLRDLDLSKFDSIFLASSGVVHLTPDDVKRVRAFAKAGGRVVVTANAFFVGTVKQANTVLDGSGLEMRDEEARGAGDNDVTLGKDNLARELIDAGVAKLHFHRGSPVALTPGMSGRAVVKAVGVGQAGDGSVAIGKLGKGEVIALGESLWWNWISEKNAAGTDNAKLLRWLLVRK